MKQKIHAIATALAFFKQNAKSLRQKAIGSLKQKAEGERLKAIRKSSQKQLTRRPFDSAQGDVVEERTVRLNYDTPTTKSQATGSAGPVKRRAGSLASGLKDRFTLIYSGCLLFFKGFHAFASLRFWVLFDLRKKYLALPPAMRREDFNSKNKSKNRDNCESSQKQLTNRLSLRPSAEPGASLITMTGKGQAVQINRVNQPNITTKQSHAIGSAGPVKRRAGSLASGMKDRFTLIFWVLFDLSKKYLALPPAMRREDFLPKNKSKKGNNPKPSKKQLTNRLLLRPSAQPDAPLITMTGKGGEAMQFSRTRRYRKHQALRPNLIVSLILIAVVVIIGKQTEAQQHYRPLSIGSTVPDIPLGTVTGYTDSGTLKTSDFADRLLILDFWATWCSPCVASFPKMDSLRKHFGKQLFILPVTGQPKRTVETFLGNMYKVKGLRAFSVVGDTLLKKIFPNSELPHYVWIKNGKLIAVTDGSQVKEPLIKAVLAGNTSSLKLKDDAAKLYDTKYPLFSEHNGIPPASILNYHLFGRYVPGYRSMLESAITPDGGRKIVAINFSAYKLYQLAYSKVKPALLGSENRILVTASDTLALKGPGFKRVGKEAYRNWQKEHAYCYEIGSASASTAIWTQMQEDLKRAFPQWDAGLEEKNSKCLVMRCKDPQLLKSKGGAAKLQESKYAFSMQNKDWNILINRLTSYYLQLSPLPLIDETGITGAVDLSISCNLSDVEALRKALAAYGISIAEEDRALEMIVIRDSQPSN